MKNLALLSLGVVALASCAPMMAPASYMLAPQASAPAGFEQTKKQHLPGFLFCRDLKFRAQRRQQTRRLRPEVIAQEFDAARQTQMRKSHDQIQQPENSQGRDQSDAFR